MKAGKKQSRTKQAMRLFKEWNTSRYPLKDREGNSFEFGEEVDFVAMYNYSEGKIDKKYYVSNMGHILSCTGYGSNQTGEKIMVLTESGNKDESGYVIVRGWRLHKLVWFSFVADSLEKGEDVSAKYGIQIDNMKELKALAVTAKQGDTKKVNDKGIVFDIHHKDLNPKNNKLSNLQALPEEVHTVLHNLQRADEDDAWEDFNEMSDTLSTYYPRNVIAMEVSENSAELMTLDQSEIQMTVTDDMRDYITEKWMNAYGIELFKWAGEESIRLFGIEYFHKRRTLVVRTPGGMGYISYKRYELDFENNTQRAGIKIGVGSSNMEPDMYYDSTKYELFWLNYAADGEDTVE